MFIELTEKSTKAKLRVNITHVTKFEAHGGTTAPSTRLSILEHDDYLHVSESYGDVTNMVAAAVRSMK